jgi:hypothetical protein
MEKYCTFELSGCVARVYLPNITEKERERRIKQITKAAVELLAERRTHEEHCIERIGGNSGDSVYAGRVYA